MNSEKKKRKWKISGTDIVLVVIAIYVVIFNQQMIKLFEQFQVVPDVLISVVYAVTFGELGFCTMIYKHKHKIKEEDNGIHGQDILPEDQTDGNQGYAGEQDLGVLDSGTGVHRVKKRKLWFNK